MACMHTNNANIFFTKGVDVKGSIKTFLQENLFTINSKQSSTDGWHCPHGNGLYVAFLKSNIKWSLS